MWTQALMPFMVFPCMCSESFPAPEPKADERPGSTVEVEFEPMGGRGPSPQELLSMLAGSDDSRGVMLANSYGPVPAVGSLFSSILAGSQPPHRSSRQHRNRGHLESGDAALSDFLSDGSSWGPIPLGEGSSVPVSVFHDLFPGPLGAMDSPEEVEVMNAPAAPDLMVADMLQHLNRMFKEDMLPTISRTASSSRSRAACQDDTRTLCNGTRWQLHCLGQHASQISDVCRKRVGKSVPFLCHKAIGRWCDGLDRGILPCLGDRLSQLDGSCRDAVVATHRVIAKVNTQRATMQDPATGQKVTYAPTVPSVVRREEEPAATSSIRPAPAAQREVQLDSIIASAPTKRPAAQTQDHSESTSTKKPTGQVIAAPHQAVKVERAEGTLQGPAPPASNPVLAASAKAAPAVQGQAGHVSGLLQAAVMVALVGTCVYLWKSQVGVSTRRVAKKGGALLELNTNTPDHML